VREGSPLYRLWPLDRLLWLKAMFIKDDIHLTEETTEVPSDLEFLIGVAPSGGLELFLNQTTDGLPEIIVQATGSTDAEASSINVVRGLVANGRIVAVPDLKNVRLVLVNASDDFRDFDPREFEIKTAQGLRATITAKAFSRLTLRGTTVFTAKFGDDFGHRP
jgi:hypothetical protein